MFVWTACYVKNFEHNFEQTVVRDTSFDLDGKIGLKGRQKGGLDGKIGLKGRQKGGLDGKIGLEGRRKVDLDRKIGLKSRQKGAEGPKDPTLLWRRARAQALPAKP